MKYKLYEILILLQIFRQTLKIFYSNIQFDIKTRDFLCINKQYTKLKGKGNIETQ